jgi:hypothetical protein
MATGTQPLEEKGRQVMGDAKEAAQTKLNEQRQAAASGLGDFAGALRTAARDMNGRNATVARFAETAAERLERLSGTMNGKDLDGIVREAESFARREPMLFFGAAVAAGFLAIRFLKSGGAPNTQEPTRRM